MEDELNSQLGTITNEEIKTAALSEFLPTDQTSQSGTIADDEIETPGWSESLPTDQTNKIIRIDLSDSPLKFAANKIYDASLEEIWISHIRLEKLISDQPSDTTTIHFDGFLKRGPNISYELKNWKIKNDLTIEVQNPLSLKYQHCKSYDEN